MAQSNLKLCLAQGQERFKDEHRSKWSQIQTRTTSNWNTYIPITNTTTPHNKAYRFLQYHPSMSRTIRVRVRVVRVRPHSPEQVLQARRQRPSRVWRRALWSSEGWPESWWGSWGRGGAERAGGRRVWRGSCRLAGPVVPPERVRQEEGRG